MFKESIKPSKKPAPPFIPFVGAVLYVIVAVFIIVGVVDSFWFFIIPVVIIVFLSVLSRLYSWYVSAEVRQTNEFDVYEVTEITNTMGHNKTKYHINRVSAVVRRGSSVIVYGDIVVFEPLRKGKEVKRCKILDASNEIFLYFFNKVTS